MKRKQLHKLIFLLMIIAITVMGVVSILILIRKDPDTNENDTSLVDYHNSIERSQPIVDGVADLYDLISDNKPVKNTGEIYTEKETHETLNAQRDALPAERYSYILNDGDLVWDLYFILNDEDDVIALFSTFNNVAAQKASIYSFIFDPEILYVGGKVAGPLSPVIVSGELKPSNTSATTINVHDAKQVLEKTSSPQSANSYTQEGIEELYGDIEYSNNIEDIKIIDQQALQEISDISSIYIHNQQ